MPGLRSLLPVSAAALAGSLVAACAVFPRPFDGEQVAAFSSDWGSRVVVDQEPLRGPVTLFEAIARALKYTLDHRVELMETSLRLRQLDVEHYSALPNAVVSSGYANRDNYSGGESRRILSSNSISGAPSLTSSTSSEREVMNGDLTFSWHVLDFGLSYVRARQAADRALIANETRRKVVNRLTQNVRAAYWRAVSAERMITDLRSLQGRVEAALKGSQALSQRAQASPLTALTYERELVEIKRELQRLYDDLSVAKTQLAALMNLDPGTGFRVAVPSRQRQPRKLGLSARQMVDSALRNRSELREVAYQSRINRREAEAEILQMLPGVSFEGGPNFNTNDFLFNQNWVSWGARASWNLMRVFSYRARKAENEAREDLLDTRALAVTMAIMTQVHVARVRLIHARRKHRTAREFYGVQWRILGQIRQSLRAGKVSEQTAIREEMNTLVARVKLDLAFVELQNAHATAHASIGTDPIDPQMAENLSVPDLARALRRNWGRVGDRQATLPGIFFVRPAPGTERRLRGSLADVLDDRQREPGEFPAFTPLSLLRRSL